MAHRKYISEFGLNMMTDYIALLQQEHLHQIDDSDFKPHIYLVTRRPRITLVPESVIVTEEKVQGRFQKQVKDQFVSIPFEIKNYFGSAKVSLLCEYPYTEYAFIDESGNKLACGKCALLLSTIDPKLLHHLDLEVLYIGQSYGKAGERIASGRLRNHSTLQGIYAEAIKNSPDQDIWLVLSTFEALMLASFDGRHKEYGTSFDEDTEHIHKITHTDISEQQKINFTEASLIKYFQPPYNTIYKNSFPNPAHSTYSECYDIDLNAVNVEVQTEYLGIRLWSEIVKPKWVHLCSFPLHSSEDRKSMFDFDL